MSAPIDPTLSRSYREIAGMKRLSAAAAEIGDLGREALADSRAMTLEEAKSIARHLGLTLRKVRSGDYRVSFREGDETTAYYSDNLEDAVNAAVEMARKRELRSHRAGLGPDPASRCSR
jgi:hypothetical protein